ncbi:MAG: hypothetical protein LUI60_03390 [Clostridia bacterium]|nr:hypothetical protein [Clostridia bacterium]
MINSICAALATYQIVIIVMAVVAVVFVVICAIIGHKKGNKNADDKVLESRGEVNGNVQAIEVLLLLAEDKPEIQARLKILQDKIKYLTPSPLKEVSSIDEKISNALGDAKIELSKTRGDKKSGKAEKYLDQVELLIAERSAYTER